jgi:thiol-disulfide isomerase/thioredoxin
MRRKSGFAGGILLALIAVLLLAAPVNVASVQSQGMATPTPLPMKGPPGGTAPLSSPPPSIPDITLDGRLQFIEFYADWCGPCIDMRPHLIRMEGRYSPLIRFWRIDVDARESDRIEAYFGGVPAIPLVIVLDAQGGVIVRMEGFQSERQLDRLLHEIFTLTGTRKPDRIDTQVPLSPPGPDLGADEVITAPPREPGTRRPVSAVYPRN